MDSAQNGVTIEIIIIFFFFFQWKRKERDWKLFQFIEVHTKGVFITVVSDVVKKLQKHEKYN